MRNHLVLVLFASLSLFACAGANKEAKNADADVWADFKGTYSQTGGSSGEKTAKSDSTKKDAKAKSGKSDAKSEKSASRGTVNGESLSTVSAESLAGASKTALKAKLVSNNVTTGSTYELVQVQLKGATVQVIRPASTPASNGPSVQSPKAKNDALAKNEAAWYDEEADVLVVVQGAKKGSAQKALAALVKR